MDITPCTHVNVKVTSQPTNAAAQKTLVRLLTKSVQGREDAKRLKKARQGHAKTTQRGGRVRVWGGRVIKQHTIKGNAGEQATIFASHDVVKDLNSVARFIDVTPAN